MSVQNDVLTFAVDEYEPLVQQHQHNKKQCMNFY